MLKILLLLILFFKLSSSLLYNNSYLNDNNTNKARKLLFYVPTLSFSHVAFNQKIAKLLADNGLDVVS